ncbi:MAG: CBS domain-containing protein [Thermodesulfobacteriota bacterium]
MLKAKDMMSRDLVTVSPGTDIVEAARLLIEKGINGVPVVEGGKLVGILCQSDLIALQKGLRLPSVFTLLDGFIPLGSTARLEKTIQRMAATKVSEAMTPNPVTAGPETTVEELATLMVDKKYHTIPIVDQGRLVGVVGKEDILKTLMPGGEAA